MDTLEKDCELIEKILTEHTRIPYRHGKISFETVFDRVGDHYLVMLVGRDERRRRVHGALIHVDIIDGRFWIQRDGTEVGIARELLDAGIPRERIVMAFRWDEALPQETAALV